MGIPFLGTKINHSLVFLTMLQKSGSLLGLHVVLSKWSTFQNRWQKVPPMMDPKMDDFAQEMQSPLGEIVSLWEKLVSSKGVVNAGVPVADS